MGLSMILCSDPQNRSDRVADKTGCAKLPTPPAQVAGGFPQMTTTVCAFLGGVATVMSIDCPEQ